MKSLATLIKLQKTYVDEQRQLVTKLQAQLDAIQQKIIEIEVRKAQEQVAAEENPGARQTYGAFLKKMIAQARELDKQQQVMTEAVAAARDKLAQLFEEQKRYEIAEAARAEAEATEERRRERIDLDEIGSVGFVRRRGE